MNWINDLNDATVIILFASIFLTLTLLILPQLDVTIDSKSSRKIIAVLFGFLIAMCVENSGFNDIHSANHQFLSGKLQFLGEFSYHKGKSDYKGVVGCIAPCNADSEVKFSIYFYPGTLLNRGVKPRNDYAVEYLQDVDMNPLNNFEYQPSTNPLANTRGYHRVVNLYDLTNHKSIFYEDTQWHIYRILIDLAGLIMVLVAGIRALRLSSKSKDESEMERLSESDDQSIPSGLRSLKLNGRGE